MLTRRAFEGLSLVAVLLLVPALAGSEEKENPILTFVKSRVKDPKKPFTLTVRLKVKEGSGEKFETTFAKALTATRKEKGCINYDLNRDTDNTGRYLVYERWKNLEALGAHLNSDHIKALLAALPELLEGEPEPGVLIPAGE
jgi:quinol monooxygenase YgiN